MLGSGYVMVLKVSAIMKLIVYWGCTRVTGQNPLSAIRGKGCVPSVAHNRAPHLGLELPGKGVSKQDLKEN